MSTICDGSKQNPQIVRLYTHTKDDPRHFLFGMIGHFKLHPVGIVVVITLKHPHRAGRSHLTERGPVWRPARRVASCTTCVRLTHT